MAYSREAMTLFDLANPAYANASVGFYAVDLDTGLSTGEFIDLYTGLSGSTEWANPLTLDSTGKVSAPVYYEAPFIAVVDSSEVGTHQTGIVVPAAGGFQGEWESGIFYLPGNTVKDGDAGAGTNNIYVANAEHTSGTWATDLGESKWTLLIDVQGAEEAESNAAISAAAAATSATAASTSATAAATSATAASTAQTNAETAETNAETAQAAAEAALAAASIPGSLSGQAGKQLFVKSDETQYVLDYPINHSDTIAAAPADGDYIEFLDDTDGLPKRVLKETLYTAIDTYVRTQAASWTDAQGYAISTLTDAASSGGNVSWDVTADPVAKLTMDNTKATRVIANPSNIVAGRWYTIIIEQDGTGGVTMTWGTYFDWQGGVAPSMPQAANAVIAVSVFAYSTTRLLANAGINYS